MTSTEHLPLISGQTFYDEVSHTASRSADKEGLQAPHGATLIALLGSLAKERAILYAALPA